MHIPAQVEGIIMVTRNEEMRQHRVKTVLLEEKVTITVSAQEHERRYRNGDISTSAEQVAVWVNSFSVCAYLDIVMEHTVR